MIEAARPAGDGDVGALEALTTEAATLLGGQRGGPLFLQREARRPPWADSWRRSLAADSEHVVVGTIDGTVVGLGSVSVEILPDEGPLGRVLDLFVTPGARGIGVGEAIMDQLVAWAATNGCRGIDSFALPGDRATKNFFERFGLVARGIVVHRKLAP